MRIFGSSCTRFRFIYRTFLAMAAIATCLSPSHAQLSIHGVAAVLGAYRQTTHVNAELGTDSPASGSLSAPYKTLNYALQQAWNLNSTQSQQFISVIQVHASAVPIAPMDFGGAEYFGWVATGEPPRKPFPIRMLGHVYVSGVATRSGELPVITINELDQFPAVPYDSSHWTPGIGEQRSVILGADDCRLDNFSIDGQHLIDSSAGVSDWPGVRVLDANNFTLAHCDVGHWQDELWLEAATDSNIVYIEHCTIHDAWPFTPMKGHAGIWMTGDHTSDVHLTATTVRTTHDGFDFAGEVLAPGATETLTVTACRFEDNENGFELVGPAGMLVSSIDSSIFQRNFSKGIASGGVDPTTQACGAIVMRNDPGSDTTVKTCDFRDNGYSILWKTMSSTNKLNLGKSSALGENNFCLNFSAYPPLQDPYRVCLFYTSPIPADAVGNYWLRNDQGADANGAMLIGSQTATSLPSGNLFTFDPVYLLPISPPAPPGPFWGQFQPLPVTPGTLWLRNFSMAVGSTIDFGTIPPSGAAPDCETPP